MVPKGGEVEHGLVEVKEHLPAAQDLDELQRKQLAQANVCIGVDVGLVVGDASPAESHVLLEEPLEEAMGDLETELNFHLLLYASHCQNALAAVHLSLHYLLDHESL